MSTAGQVGVSPASRFYFFVGFATIRSSYS